jgi:hypothetical protein
MICVIFTPKKIGGKNDRFDSKYSRLCGKFIITLVFEKIAHVFVENGDNCLN